MRKPPLGGEVVLADKSAISRAEHPSVRQEIAAALNARLLIAAAAQEACVGVLHDDRHFDRLAEVLHFRSVWLAPAGSL